MADVIPGKTYNPQTGVYVANQNITATSVATPAYSYFNTQEGKQALAQSQTPTSGNVQGAGNVPPAPGGYTPTPQVVAAYESRQSVLKAEAGKTGAGQAMEKYGISPETQRYLFETMGIAPSDNNPAALQAYVNVAKQYEGKLGTETQRENFGEYNKVRLLAQSQGYQVSDVKNVLVNQSGQTVGFTTNEGKEVLVYSMPKAATAEQKAVIATPLPTQQQPRNMSEAVLMANQAVVKGNAEYNAKEKFIISKYVTPKTEYERQAALQLQKEANTPGITVNLPGIYSEGYANNYKDVSPTGWGLAVKERAKQLQAEEEYRQKLPGGREHGLGASERFTYASNAVFGEKPAGLTGVAKGGVNVVFGFFPGAVDIGAQAVKNVPAAAEAYNKNRIGFAGDVFKGTAYNLRDQTGATLSTAKAGIEGNPVALGETLALGAVFVAPAFVGKMGQPRIESVPLERFGWAVKDSSVGKTYNVVYAWEKGGKAYIKGGVEIQTGGASVVGVKGFRGLPKAPTEGTFQLNPAKSPVATAIADKMLPEYGQRLSTLKPNEAAAYNNLVKDYAKGAENAQEQAFVKDYVKANARSIYEEGKALTVEAYKDLKKSGYIEREAPESVFSKTRGVQNPEVVTKKPVGQMVLDWVRQRKAEAFGSVPQRIQMGPSMSRGYGKDYDLVARNPTITESTLMGKMPTFRKVTAEGLATEATSLVSPSFKPGSITAEGGLVERAGQGHIFDIKDKPSMLSVETKVKAVKNINKDYVKAPASEAKFKTSYSPEIKVNIGSAEDSIGFGLKGEKAYLSKGIYQQTLTEQSVAKGESAFRPNRIGAVPEAHRFKDILDTVDIAKEAARRTGNKDLLRRAEQLEAKLPKEMKDYYRSGEEAKGETTRTRSEEALQYQQSQRVASKAGYPKAYAVSAIASKVSISSIYPSRSSTSRISSGSPYSQSSKPSSYNPSSKSSFKDSSPSPSPSPSKPSSYKPSSSSAYSPESYKPSRPSDYYRPSSYKPSSTYSPSSSKKSDNPPPPPPPPPLPMRFPAFSIGSMGQGSKLSIKNQRTYNPSVAAVLLNIRAKKAPKATFGAEIRPIVPTKGAQKGNVFGTIAKGRKK